MTKYFRYISFCICCFIFYATNLSSQVVFRELLSQNHEGEISNSQIANGKNLQYKWNFESLKKGKYFTEAEAIESIQYSLRLLSNNKELATFKVNMRDLIVSLYIDVYLDSDPEHSSISGIYNKTNRWLKVKHTLKKECLQENENWIRKNDISSFDQLLNHIIAEFDRRVIFNCLSIPKL